MMVEYKFYGRLAIAVQVCESAPGTLSAARRAPTPSYRDDDDLGLLLAVLLLAARNKGCGCCNCCNRAENTFIPIPYPIPIPTNNPIIASRLFDHGYSYDKEEADSGEGGGGWASSGSIAAATGGRGTGGTGGTGGSSSGTSTNQSTQIINIRTCDCEDEQKAEDEQATKYTK